MDPISAIAAVVGAVATAIDVGSTIYNMIDGITSAPDNVRRLSVELRGLHHVLGLLSGSLEAQQRKASHDGFPVHMVYSIKELVDNCLDVFNEISQVVQPYLQMQTEKSVLKQWSKGFKWELGKKATITSLQTSLSNNKATLELAISTLNL